MMLQSLLILTEKSCVLPMLPKKNGFHTASILATGVFWEPCLMPNILLIMSIQNKYEHILHYND
jgi:hypothetical protein